MRPFRHDRRARLTFPDVVFLLVTFGFIAALFPVAQTLIRENADSMSTGTELLFVVSLPFMLLVMLYLLFVKAAVGAPR